MFFVKKVSTQTVRQTYAGIHLSRNIIHFIMGSECQRKDWSRHKRLCVPVAVAELEERGRGLVATKRIATGDLMVRDEAVIRLGERPMPTLQYPH